MRRRRWSAWAATGSSRTRGCRCCTAMRRWDRSGRAPGMSRRSTSGERVARLTLNRPGRGNGLTPELLSELARCVERADLDPDVRVLLLAGHGKGFCGGYDLVWSAEGRLPNHDPSEPWDPMIDHSGMSRNVRTFMSLFHCSKPVICKVHGFCVAGGTDLALG